MIRIGVADDHRLFVDGIRNAISSIPDMTVVMTASTTDELLEALPGARLDVLLLDLEMPDVGGAEILRTQSLPPTIVVTMHAGAETEAAVLGSGALAMLPKSVPLSELAAVIRMVADGAAWPSSIADRQDALARYASARLDPAAESLTEREREILGLLANGVTATDELADQLFISPKTVKNHLASIFSKLAVADRTQAALEAIRLGIARDR